MIDEDIEPQEGELDILQSDEDCMSHVLCRCLCHISNDMRHNDRCCYTCRYCHQNILDTRKYDGE